MISQENPWARFNGIYAPIIAITFDWVYEIDETGLLRHAGLIGASNYKFDRDFASPITELLKQNDLDFKNIQRIIAHLDKNLIEYRWEDKAFWFHTDSNKWKEPFVCVRCDGNLDFERVSVCVKCEPFKT